MHSFKGFLFLFLVWLSFWCYFFVIFGVNFSLAQTSIPRSAAPERLEKRFKRPERPKSMFKKIFPKSREELSPKELNKIRFFLRGLFVKGSTVYSNKRFSRLDRKFRGKEISLKKVYEWRDRITAKYRNDGYILSQAVIVPQEISNGIVVIQIIEGYISDVMVSGEINGPKSFLSSYIKGVKEVRPLNAQDLERYLLFIDDLPGVSVQSVLSPSKKNDKSGATTLKLVLENKQYDTNIGFDNKGTKFNGPFQVSFGASENANLNLFEQIGINGVVTTQTDELLFISGLLRLPLTSEGTLLSISGSVSASEPGATLKDFQIVGDSKTFTYQLSHPFRRSRGENLRGTLTFTSKNSKTDILGALASEDRIRILSLGTSYDFIDRFKGLNLIGLTLHQGINIFDATEPGSPNLTRVNGKSNFTKLTGNSLRIQQLFPRFSLLGAMNWQYSFDNLLSSEEFGIGGAQFVRGYDSSEATGAQGLAFKLEFQYGLKIKFPYLKDIQGFAFYDRGNVWAKGADSGAENPVSLDSFGFGMRYNVTNSISGAIEVDFPMAGNVSSEGNKDPRMFFSLGARM